MSTLYRAAWILPVESPPVHDGWLLVDRGRIAAVGAGTPPAFQSEVHLGSAAILPGLVNAHTHLELSWMRGRVPPSTRMPAWIRDLMRLRREVHRDDPLAMAAAVGELRRAGTSLVGDITNTCASLHALGASPIGGCVFYELLGFNHPTPAARVAEAAAMAREANGGARRTGGADLPGPRIHVSITPHAPYSVSPALFREIAALAQRERWVTSVHLGESAEEIEFLLTGRGPWRELIDELGVWDESWRAPGTGPVAYLEGLGAVTCRTLVVHGVQLTDPELARIRDIGATLVSCPRSNEWAGAGPPPVARFYGSGVRVAVGTDSLASCPDLNLFSELAAMRRLAPEVPASRLLHSATLAGAEALGFGDEHGALTAGRRADVISVAVPAGTTDVEEYLCSGIQPDAVRWLAPGARTGPLASEC